MNRNLLWRGMLILAVAVVCVALAYPPKKKINLGLDLQGGMHLVLQVHTEDALRAETDSDMARLIDPARTRAPRPQGRRTGDRRSASPPRRRRRATPPASWSRSTCRAGRSSGRMTTWSSR